MDNEAGVSPSIGVILMVAITVIIAAIVAAFLFGTGSELPEEKFVPVTAKQVDTRIIITYHGIQAGTGLYRDDVAYINATVYKGGIEVTDSDFPDFYLTDPQTGETITYTNATAGQEHLVCVAKFADGTEQVILDKTL